MSANKKQIAELAALLALRAAKGGACSASRIGADALALAQLAASAETNAVRLCNLVDYQEKFDAKKARIEKTANGIVEAYGLRAHHTGDPRGFCLRLVAAPGAEVVRGNSLGGDEEGYGL